MATYGGISKLYIIQIHIYLFFRFTDKLCGTKTEQSDVSTYGGRIHVYIYIFGYAFSSQMWLCMAGYLNYLSSRYVFMSSFVSVTKYAGRKLNTLMWLRMAGEFMSIYLFGYALSSQLWLRMAGYRNYLSST